jgi:hypothetical protein
MEKPNKPIKILEIEKEFFNSSTEENINNSTQDSLQNLLKINSAYNEILYSGNEQFEADIMVHPISTEKAFSYFGLMLGSFPPAALFLKLMLEGNPRAEEFWLYGLLLLVNIVSATVGYFTGNIVGKLTIELEKLSWTWMLLILPFVGLLWGIISGGAAGLFIFIIGAFFGAFIGGAVGGVAFPVFTILHRIFKRKDIIEVREFLPFALGITLIISAFILGL